MDAPFDTHEALVRPVSGDWAEVRANADVLDHLANFAGYLRDTIERVRAQLPEAWTGNAAGLFDEYLSKLGAGFKVAEDEFTDLAKLYIDVTDHIVHAREGVTFIGDLIADKAIVASAAVIAAKTTIATPMAAITVPGALFLIAKVIKGITKGNTYLQSIHLVIDRESDRIVRYALPNLPKPDDTHSAMTHLPE